MWWELLSVKDKIKDQKTEDMFEQNFIMNLTMVSGCMETGKQNSWTDICKQHDVISVNLLN